MKDRIDVLIVDDSPVIRTILVGMIEETPGLQVVGQATDGREAVRMAAELQPDVITMDIRMPRLNGLEATRQIMSATPTPIVVVATSIYEADLNIAFNAIASGALTVVEKPQGLDPDSYDLVREQLITAIRLVADVKLVALRPADPTRAQTPDGHFGRGRKVTTRVELIAIGASTGGPGALHKILAALPASLEVPILIVQHITPGFGQGFAHWLNGVTPLGVDLAQNGEQLKPGRVFIAPEGAHMIVAPGGIVRLEQAPPLKGLRPSATRLFESAAKVYGSAAIGVILTGMGDDGADGLEKLQQAGGHVIAQDEASCVVFGMPQVAIERGVVDRVLPLNEIAGALIRLSERHTSG